MAAPSYLLSQAVANSTDPAGDIITLVETRLTAAGWVFVEETAFTQTAVARVMRVWKNPAALNAAAVDFYIGLIKNAVAGIYFAARAFEGYKTSNHTMQKPCISGAATHYPVGGYTWIARTMPASGYSALAYGNGVFVALGSASGTGATVSLDGITWTATVLPASQLWKAVTYGNGVFVAVGGTAGTISATSTDGVTWTQRVITSGTYLAVAYGNSTFTAVGSTSTVAATSPDGVTWTSRTVPASATYTSVAYGAGLFVAVRTGSTAAISSPDGITWTVVTMPMSTTWNSIAYGGGMFVAVSNVAGNHIATSSPDGITWTLRDLPNNATWNSVSYGNGLFYAVGGGTFATSSPDGITWAVRTGISMTTAVVSGNPAGQFVTVSTGTTAAASWDYDPAPNWSAGNKDWLADGTTQPPIAEAQPTAVLATSTNYDVAVLASRSYLVLGVYAAGTGNMKIGWVLGLINPVYPDSIATFPPLAVITTTGSPVAATAGVSRSMRNLVSANAFGAAVGPESLLIGCAFSLAREPAGDMLRTARVAVGGVQFAGFTPAQGGSGYRGWLSDCIAASLSGSTAVRPTNTVTIGGTTYNVMATSAATAAFSATNTTCAFAFDTSAGT